MNRGDGVLLLACFAVAVSSAIVFAQQSSLRKYKELAHAYKQEATNTEIIFIHTEEDFCGTDNIGLKRLSLEQVKEFIK